MKRTLFLSLLLASIALPLHADVEWDADTTVSGDITENIIISESPSSLGNLTFDGGSGSEITVQGADGSDVNLSGNGTLHVKSGTVIFDGVSRTGSTGNITIDAGATLKLQDSTILSTEYHGAVVTVKGTLYSEGLGYSTTSGVLGSLGAIKDNVGSLVLYGSDSAQDCTRIVITKDSSATIGVKLQPTGWTGYFFGITVAEGVDFNWAASGNGSFNADAANGCAVILCAEDGATFTMGKNVGAGVKLVKTRSGELIINSTINLSGTGRHISIEDGTLTLATEANIQSAGEGVFVGENGILNLNGKNGPAGASAEVKGEIINGQNNAMLVELKSTGTFSISADATSGHNGTLTLEEGATVDLDGHVFYNTIDMTNGGTLDNAEHFRGSIKWSGHQEKSGSDLAAMESGLVIEQSLSVSLTEDLNLTAKEDSADILNGRMQAGGGIRLQGTDTQDVTISGYKSAFGAMNTQAEDDRIRNVVICNVDDVTLSNNAATMETDMDYQRGGAIASASAVTIDAAGELTISGNSSSGQADSAGAIYAANDLTLKAASISSEGNENEWNAGALRGHTTSLESTAGDIVIEGNASGAAGEEGCAGGAVYGVNGVTLKSAADIRIADNSATGDGGAIYSMAEVTITPGEDGAVSIAGNTAGYYGGAIYSAGSVTLSGGSMEISGNTAGSGGGAIYAEGDVNISADAGDITFSDNQLEDGTANDIELWDGTANLSASSGYTLEMQGGIIGAGAINITTADDSSVKLGSSETYELTVTDGRLAGVANEEGEMATISVETAVALENAVLEDILILGNGDAVLSALNSIYVYNAVPALTLGVMNGTNITVSAGAPLLDGFTSLEGGLVIDVTLAYLQNVMTGAGDTPVDMVFTLMMDGVTMAEDGTFTFSLSQELVALLEQSELTEYGFYDGEDNLLAEQELVLTAESPTEVHFAIKGVTKLVPEPTSATLSLLALAALTARRRRR